MFGGRLADGSASNNLLIFKVHEDKYTGKAAFTIIKPKTKGQPPPPRYSHTIDFVPKLGIVVIAGGRNDDNIGMPVLDDLWIIKIASLEYQRLTHSGRVPASPRCGHCSFVHGSELLICGGQSTNFAFTKNIIHIELD